MFRPRLWFLLIFFLLSACGSNVQETPIPTETPVPPTRTSAPSPTPRQQVASPTPIPDRETSPTPGPTIDPSPAVLPDFSEVELYEATHLMDPRMFQVSMDGWPDEVPENLIVRVGFEFYTCEVLFPERFPNRVYCWGKAPTKGTEVKIQVILEDVPGSLLEIPFVVPYPSNDGG